ncbi:MAG: nucleotide-binding protein [Nitrospinae bacterium]|nr:nucleotide-binding protein [Nitrospinota bacterium]
MEKIKVYKEARFFADVLKEALEVSQGIAKRSKNELKIIRMIVEHKDSTWKYDSLEEFLADYRQHQGNATLHTMGNKVDFVVDISPRSAQVSVRGDCRPDIETVFGVFEKHLNSSKLPPIPRPSEPEVEPVVFIGHGGSPLWRDLKDHLQDKHKIKVEAYETGARAGHTIRDILEELVKKSSFALLVLTAEDEMPDGTFRARQNVIHEVGLFQGRIGFARAVVLLEEGAEEFSNIQGIQQIRFSKGNIKETFGEVVATIRREFGN